MWGATRGATGQTGAKGVSIHAPRVGCDCRILIFCQRHLTFQFTHPVWGATKLACTHLLASSFNSRTPCGVRPVNLSTSLSFALFQFTHPVWGATTSEDYPATPYLRFQFTHPVWGATIGEGALRIAREVSIHAPRVGCDTVIDEIESLQHKFQFTHPVWGATQGATKGNSPAHKFQFTHPVWGATDLFGKAIAPHLSFNSRTPCGVRP